MIPLFEYFPTLAEKLPYLSLAGLPTPAADLARFAEEIGIPGLYIKRDDLSGTLYGGNKVRSLEFLLASAHRTQENVVVGLAGTNMALAANVYAREYKVPLRTLLIRQKPTAESRRNLKHFALLGARLAEIPAVDQLDEELNRLKSASLAQHGRPMFVLDPTSLLGMVGFVNAALELAHQVAAGLIPRPDRIYIAGGLLGTTSGLLLGLQLAGMDSRVVVVLNDRTGEAARQETVDTIRLKHAALGAYLQVLAPDFVEPEFDPEQLVVRTGAEDDPLSLVKAGLSHAELLMETEGVLLDPTWTAQVLGAILADAAAGALNSRTTLFWHTLGAHPAPPDLDQIDYHLLPEVFWRHFESNDLALINQPEQR